MRTPLVALIAAAHDAELTPQPTFPTARVSLPGTVAFSLLIGEVASLGQAKGWVQAYLAGGGQIWPFTLSHKIESLLVPAAAVPVLAFSGVVATDTMADVLDKLHAWWPGW